MIGLNAKHMMDETKPAIRSHCRDGHNDYRSGMDSFNSMNTVPSDSHVISYSVLNGSFIGKNEIM